MPLTFQSEAGGGDSLLVNAVKKLTFNGDGTAQLATNPSATDRSMALATLKSISDNFTGTKNQNGWVKLPSGLIIQWGLYSFKPPAAFSAVYNGDGTIITQFGQTTNSPSYTFPIAFPTGCAALHASPYGSDEAIEVTISGYALTASNFTLRATRIIGTTPGDQDLATFVIAVGY